MTDYLTQLMTEYEQIALNRIDSLEEGLSEEQFISACKSMTENTRQLRRSTEKQLNEKLFPALDNITEIADDFESELYATAQKLSSYETKHDPGLALKIYKALLERARSRHDDAKTIKYLYWCGLTLFFITEEHGKILAYFEEGASFADRYDDFEDPETRQYIHRCLGNLSMEYYATKQIPKAMASDESNFSFWNKLIFSGKDPDFPWLNYFLTGLNHKHGYITKKVHTDPDSETKANLRVILDNAITINKLYQKNKESFRALGGTRYDFILWEAQLLSELISFDHLIDNINRKKAEFAPDDYSADAMYVKVQLNSYLMFYAAKMRKLSKWKDEVIATASKDVVEHFSKMPMSVSLVDVSTQLQLFARNLGDVFSPDEHMEFVVKMTTFRHIPTYAHSIMVSRIAGYLTRVLIKKRPEQFIGFMGIAGIEDVQSRAEKICHFAETSGLCHDIGITASISSPYMKARILTEEEFDIIKNHTNEGVSMMSREDGATLNDGYIDIIAGHHKYYDNSGGYPDSFNINESKYKAVIHIITAADSIVAATDDISRAYTEPKSLDAVCAEIKKEAGRCYSPVVSDILEDDTVRAEIAEMLALGRQEAYYTAYLQTWSEGNR